MHIILFGASGMVRSVQGLALQFILQSRDINQLGAATAPARPVH